LDVTPNPTTSNWRPFGGLCGRLKGFCVSVNGLQDNTFSIPWNGKAHLLRYIKILFPKMRIMLLRGLVRPQYDRPAVCVIAQRYSSSTFAPSSKRSRNNQSYLKRCIISIILFFNCLNRKLFNLNLWKSWIVCNRLERV